MKHLILCLLCIIIIYARDDSLAYKNIEFYEQKPYLIGDDTDKSIDEKYSIYDSGWIEEYGKNKEIKTLFLQGYTVNPDSTPSQKQNLQKIIPQHIKDFYPHEVDWITFFEPVNKPYIYEHVMGFLYITKEPCGIYSFKGIDCSNADYSISFYVTHDDENKPGEKGFLTMHIRGRQYILPAEYNKIEAIYPNIKEQLKNKSFLILPIKIQMRTAIGVNYVDIITISTILKTNSQENKEILKQYEYDCTRLSNTPYNPEYCPRKLDDRIYTYSKDLYVNVREKPDIKSNIALRIATHYPNANVKDSAYWKNLDGKIIPSESWINQRQIYLNENPEVEFVEKLYTKGLPKNGWYNVYFTDKKGNKQEGYIHKSQLSWGLY